MNCEEVKDTVCFGMFIVLLSPGFLYYREEVQPTVTKYKV